MLPLVSVIMPTYGRPERHSSAYACFANSRYPHKELLIFDDSPEVSQFFTRLSDPSVTYLYSRERISIGAKRNALIRRACGEVIAHQDDDDIYSPEWLYTMVRHLWEADFAKLSVFNIVDERDGSKWRWDTRSSGGAQKLLGSKLSLCLAVPFGLARTDVTQWGFGFSYVYRRRLFDVGCRFPDINRREDYEFVRRIRETPARLKQIPDCADLVWHSVHDRSTSTSFPQVRLDGPTPIPVVNMAASAVIGAVAGSVFGGPVGAAIGAGGASILSRLLVRRET